MLSFDEFANDILDFAYNKAPENWRVGQAVFNYVEDTYGVARAVQFWHGIDCFYMNDLIEDFIEASYEEYKKNVK